MVRQKPMAAPSSVLIALGSVLTAPAVARVGKPVSFRSAARAHGSGKIVQVLWDFDDGVPGTEPVLTHTFDRPGIYRVVLLVWDEQGRGSRSEKRLRILPAEAVSRDRRISYAVPAD